jgi:hypothetical protein
MSLSSNAAINALLPAEDGVDNDNNIDLYSIDVETTTPIPHKARYNSILFLELFDLHVPLLVTLEKLRLIKGLFVVMMILK